MYTLLVHHVRESQSIFSIIWFYHTLNIDFLLFIYRVHTGPAYETMKKCGLNEKCDGSFNYFPAIHDAVHQAKDNMAPISIITETS